MKQLAQAKKNGSLLYVGCIGVVALCWYGGKYVTGELAKIQPHQLQQFASKPMPPAQITFTPYQSAGVKGGVEASPDDASDFDDVFRAKPEPKVDVVANGEIQAPKEPKYSDSIRQILSVDSVVDNGAILNGRFTATGTVADQLAVSGTSGQMMAPTLVSVTRNRITLSIGKESFDVAVGGFGGRQ